MTSRDLAKFAFEARLQGRLDRLVSKHRYRELHPPAGIDVSSNDYLGLTNHPRVRAALQRALEQGVALGAGGSRLLRGNQPEHEALETKLAAWSGREAALFFSSGYAANAGLLSTLCLGGSVVFSDERNHASIIDGIAASRGKRVDFAHNDVDDLERRLAAHAAAETRIVVVESVYSMDGDRAPLPRIVEACHEHDALLLVDEAHAVGVYGPAGAGLLAEHGLTAAPLAAVHTCGKALGGFGAFVTCSRVVRDYLVNHCRHFIYTTAPPPLLALQTAAAIETLEREPELAARAVARGDALRAAWRPLVDLGACDTPIVTPILGEEACALKAAAAFQALGYDVRAVRPPTAPHGASRLRIVARADLSEAEFRGLLDAGCRIFANS